MLKNLEAVHVHISVKVHIDTSTLAYRHMRSQRASLIDVEEPREHGHTYTRIPATSRRCNVQKHQGHSGVEMEERVHTMRVDVHSESGVGFPLVLGKAVGKRKR
jgi:integrase